jgi:hypothetical protein
MIRGHLDAVTSGGFAEGWAFDSDSPQVVVTVALRAADGTELGRGLANLHRADMADLGFRFGWCAFGCGCRRPARSCSERGSPSSS